MDDFSDRSIFVTAKSYSLYKREGEEGDAERGCIRLLIKVRVISCFSSSSLPFIEESSKRKKRAAETALTCTSLDARQSHPYREEEDHDIMSDMSLQTPSHIMQ
jgi:hypothetical protein